MMDRSRRWAFISMVLLAGGCTGGQALPEGGDLAASPPNPYVHAQGTELRDGRNQPLQLRGVALGGWLYHESWMTNFDYQTWERVIVEAAAQGHGAEARAVIRGLGSEAGNNLDRVQPALAAKLGADSAQKVLDAVQAWPTVWGDGEGPLYAALEQRYGEAGRKQVVAAFQDAWLEEADLKAIAEQGFNTVRIATGWRALVEVHGDKQPTAPLVFDESGFRRLDTLLDWCEKYGLYGVMDLQDSPGGHNGVTGSPKRLYEDPAMQQLTIDLWVEIARRLKGRKSVAAYSLLAEPTAAPDVASMIAMYKRLYDAIRATGDPHLMVIHDGFKGLQSLPTPAAVGWTGVIYSTHLFDWGLRSLDEYAGYAALYESQFLAAEEKHQVPMFVGSFSAIQDKDYAYDGLALYLDTYNQRRWGWSLWSWKRVDDPLAREVFGETTMWGVLQTPTAAWQRPDPARDSLTTLLAKVATYDSQNFIENAKLSAVLRAHLQR